MLKTILCVFLLVVANLVNATDTTQKTTASSKVSSKRHNSNKAHKKHKKATKKRTNYMYGVATYYGGDDGFEGRRMADGRRFDSDNINFAAHPTLPLGTKLRVNDLTSHRVIYVEVTDRMPKKGRVIDLSVEAAKALGMHGRGTTKVQLTIISNKEYQEKKDTIEMNDGDDGHPH